MNERLTGLRYADFALGRFFALARQAPYFRRTLFVLVGDHGFSVAPVLTELRLLRFHVPLLFYGPQLLDAQGLVRHDVVSQLDIAPTICGLLRAHPDTAWGRDLFFGEPDQPGWAYFSSQANSARRRVSFAETACW